MSGYDLYLSNGNLLTTVNVKTVDVQQNSSLYLIGQGIPDYGDMIAQNYVWMLENFSAATPPANPLVGQIWHDRANNRETFFNGTTWQTLLSSQASSSGAFDMLPEATAIDFTTTGITTIFTGVIGHNYYPLMVLLVPNGTVSATTGPIFNVFGSVAGDVLGPTIISITGGTQFAHYLTKSTSIFATNGGSLQLNVTEAATGGLLSYDVYLFGFIQ
jgi:hypothetical protein